MYEKLNSIIESSLLYTTADGTQGFVHDTVKDFFAAKLIVDRLDSDEWSIESLYHTLNRHDASNRQAFFDVLPGNKLTSLLPIVTAMVERPERIVEMLLEEDEDIDIVVRCYLSSREESVLHLKEGITSLIIAEMKKYSGLFEQYIKNGSIFPVSGTGKSRHAMGATAHLMLNRYAEMLFSVNKDNPIYISNLFESDVRRLREIAAELASKYDFNIVKSVLENYAKHNDWRVRWNALVALGNYDTFDSRQIVFDSLRHDRCEQVAYKAASVLSFSEASVNAKHFVFQYFQDRLDNRDFDIYDSQKARDEIGT
jgi:hypothetical protein